MVCSTDDDAYIIGRYREFDVHFKKLVRNVICIHSVAHRHCLVAKTLGERQHEALRGVVKAVKLIRKSDL